MDIGAEQLLAAEKGTQKIAVAVKSFIKPVGWHGNDIRRIHHPLVHLDLIDGKVWIQRDGTEEGIAYDLEAAGIPKSDIVLAFHPIAVRPHTGYAAA